MAVQMVAKTRQIAPVARLLKMVPKHISSAAPSWEKCMSFWPNFRWSALQTEPFLFGKQSEYSPAPRVLLCCSTAACVSVAALWPFLRVNWKCPSRLTAPNEGSFFHGLPEVRLWSMQKLRCFVDRSSWTMESSSERCTSPEMSPSKWSLLSAAPQLAFNSVPFQIQYDPCDK